MRLYTNNIDRLLSIPTNGEQTNEDEEDDGIAIQEKRFETLKRILSDIELKMDHDESPSSAFATVKRQKIVSLWEKIEADDETLNDESPGFRKYKAEFSKLEILVDQCLIFLQEHMITSNNSSSNEGLKLDRVQIQKFTGDYFKWISFKDLFESMVIKNKNLSNAQRMQHLKTHLLDEAEQLISDLMVSDANFQCAWDRLLQRYHNKRVLVQKMITKLMNQPNGRGDSASIKAILDTTDQILLGLGEIHWQDEDATIVG